MCLTKLFKSRHLWKCGGITRKTGRIIETEIKEHVALEYYITYIDSDEMEDFMDGRLRNMASIYILKDNKMLLLYRQGGSVVNDVWVGSAGGHFEEYELNDAKACVLRELQEELGIVEKEIENLCLRYVTLRRIKGEIRQNYYFFADLKDSASTEFSSNEGISRWFPLSEVTSLEMPLTSKYVIEHYLNVGYKTDMVYGGVADGKQVVFTEMQEIAQKNN